MSYPVDVDTYLHVFKNAADSLHRQRGGSPDDHSLEYIIADFEKAFDVEVKFINPAKRSTRPSAIVFKSETAFCEFLLKWN